MMTNQLDDESCATIGRFVIKACMSFILGSIGQIGRTVGADGWLALYALVCGVVAIRRRDRFPTRGFNYGDEALWLTAAAAGAHVFLRVLA